MIPNRALIKQQRLASKFRRFGFFKIAPDVTELAEQAIQKLLNREDLLAMQHPLVLPSGEYAVDQPGSVTTPDAWRENHGATDNPKYNYDKWYEIKLTLNYLAQHAPQLFKFFPWVVKQIKQGNILGTGQTGHALGDRRHIQDILQQAWQHMEYLRSQPPGSPNAAPIPDINQLNFDQLQQWVYDRNSTGIDVQPGYEWDYIEGPTADPAYPPNPGGYQYEGDKLYPHEIQNRKYDVGNGWYVWPVFTKADLAKEGELMGHCVGGYCNNVHSGDSVIFSLRDPKGEPHATIELDGYQGAFNVVQVQGKQNSEPSSEYKSMVKNFFDQLKQQGIDVSQRVRIRDVNELEEYEWMSRPDDAYGLEVDADIDEDGIARDLVGQAAEGYGNESAAGTLQDLMHDGIIDYRTMESYIRDEIESRVDDKARELENDWEETKKYLYRDFQQARADEDEGNYDEEEDDGEFHEPEDDSQEFEEWLEENYPDQVYAERDNFQEAALDDMPQVYDLQQRFGSVQKWSYWPDQGGGDPRPDKIGPTLNTDYAPLEDTFDALGPCQKCNNPLTRDAEGVYCPSCGYRSNPQAENARIDMYAPLGEGIGEGPFGLMSKYWVMEGSQLPWWLPSKTAADVQELAAKASEKIWQRPDLAKYLDALNQVIEILSESGMAVDLSDFYEEDNTAFDMLVRSYDQFKQAGEEWDSDHVADIMKQNYGYGEQYIRDAIWVTPKIAPLWQDFKMGRFYHELISTMAGRYPAGYKLIPWAVNQLKKQLKDHYDINRNDVNHLADIAGQFGELTTDLRRQNKLPQGFDVNGVDMAGAEEWMNEYHAQHVGEGWDERKVWATLPNGWTVEQVSTAGDLAREGEIMGHCVGGYCRQVDSGRSIIFSLRDPNGAPHVTMEYRPVYAETNDDGTAYNAHDPDYKNPIKLFKIVQIQGKSDSKPKPEYQQMVAEFNKYLQGEGYKIEWAGDAWRHDRGHNDQTIMQLRNENTYDINGGGAGLKDGLHQLEHDYDRNGGTSFFTKQLPDQPDEYGVNYPSGVPEQWLNHVQLTQATDEVLDEILEDKIPQSDYEAWARKLVVAWYSLLSQPYASQGTRPGGPYSPKSPVDTREWLTRYINQWQQKIVEQNKENPELATHWNSPWLMEALARIVAFTLTISQKSGTQLLDMVRPEVGEGGYQKMWESAPRWRIDQEGPGTMENYVTPPDDNVFGKVAKVTPDGYVMGPREFVPYRFLIGKDDRIYGGPFSTHESLADHYGLFDDPGWNEAARGEYGPDGTQTLATWGEMAGDPVMRAQQVHDWAQSVDDPDWLPSPNGDVLHAHFTKGQGFERSQFRIAAAKWSMPMTIPQQQRAWEQTGANPEVVYQFDNGWTVRHMQTSNEVHSVGLLCRNCWQDFEADMSNGSNYYALFNQHNLPIIAFYVSGGNVGRIELPRGPRNRLIAPEEDQMLKEFAQAWSLGYHNPTEKYDPNDSYLNVLRERDMTDNSEFNAHTSVWKYAADSIPANYTESDPLDLQGKQPVFDNMQVDWWKLPPVQQRQAIVNAFRATMLSPRLNLKNNAIMYQEFMSIPADESDPDVFEQHARDLKKSWDAQGQHDIFDEVQPMGWEQQVPGKLTPGFWGNIRRLAALGPYADDLRQAALDDLNETGGKGTLFRNEVLKLGIPGVGPKVASFAWLALNPKGSDLATIDVWMMRHLNQEAESPNTPNHYFQLEDQLRDEKDAMYGPNTPLGQYQWGVWDKIRTPGFHQDHSPLKVHDPTPYTDIAWTPQYRAPRPQQLPEQAPGQEQLFANHNG